MKLIQDLGFEKIGKYKVKFGLYECPICKNHFKTRTKDVNYGKSTKCKSCSITISKTTHGLKNHRIYSVWKDIKRRINDSKYKEYKNYGGRGISVCDRWLDVKNFIEDMYQTYEEGLTIDRINNNGNYEPSNCRWATKETQQRNTRVLRKTNTSGYRGVSFNKKNNIFVAGIGVNNKVIHLGTFKTAEDAGCAYDKYVIDNNLEHTTNGLYKKGKSYDKK